MSGALQPKYPNSGIEIGGETRLLGLIAGEPRLSLSPHLHNRVLAGRNLPYTYLPLRVRADDSSALKEALLGLRALGFLGANITAPHKRRALDYVDYLTPEAQRIGAINTLRIDEAGHLWGHNTDAEGFLRSLEYRNITLKNKHAVILGAGGAARAIMAALSDKNLDSLWVVNRHRGRAAALVDEFQPKMPSQAFDFDGLCHALEGKGRPDLIVNCTSVGSATGTPGNPWPENLSLGAGQVVIDLVYTPIMTPLLTAADKAGAQILDGLDMLALQGALSFAYWLECEAPEREMLAVVEEVRCSSV